MEYVITEKEKDLLNKTGVMTERLLECWLDFIANLPKNLASEASEKRVSLVDHPINIEHESSRGFSTNSMFIISEATPELKTAMNIPENLVICMYDPV
ncbi:MAG TPA: hypothetical protein VGA67_01375 [Candidatus Dojkabacteria bacterium]|jgi:hypothetical protein